MRPAWVGYFADPDVIRMHQGYFAYGTGAPDEPREREFPVLFSSDLRSWTPLEGALERPAGLAGAHFWAPEVAEIGGQFLLYYSAGGEEGQGQRLRVATSPSPGGPFIDQGATLLPDEPFSIDASPFRDPQTGAWWLFFAKDYLDGAFPGTGLAVVRLGEDFVSVAGEAIEVLRPSADWQLFERNRFWYGRTWPAWYTAEGPFCIFRRDRYWLFYSGGLWKSDSYGMDVAVADRPEGPYRSVRGTNGPTLLRSGPDLRGPGHCSVVSDPSGIDHLCFHAWDPDYTKRQMFVAELRWNSDGPIVLG